MSRRDYYPEREKSPLGYHRERDRGRKGISVFVRGLSYRTTKSAINDIFSRFGALKDIHIPVNYNTGEPRGFAYVEFFEERDGYNAIEEMNDTEIDGRVISVMVAQGERKSSREMRHKMGSGSYRRAPRHYSRRDDEYGRDYRGAPYKSGRTFHSRRTPNRYEEERGGYGDDRRRGSRRSMTPPPSRDRYERRRSRENDHYGPPPSSHFPEKERRRDIQGDGLPRRKEEEKEEERDDRKRRRNDEDERRGEPVRNRYSLSVSPPRSDEEEDEDEIEERRRRNRKTGKKRKERPVDDHDEDEDAPPMKKRKID